MGKPVQYSYYHIILLRINSTLGWDRSYKCSLCYNLNAVIVKEEKREKNNGSVSPIENRRGVLFKPLSNIKNIVC